MRNKIQNERKLIAAWLFVGMVMVFIQIILGGITRLTGSGLSITKWDILMGALPPKNQVEWIDAFDLYKQTPQYQRINIGMSIGDFKFIFFWEFFHRLWARTMGIVFIIPFIYFLVRKSFDRKLIKHLLVVIGFASLAAVFGWVMVASGLIERPWVNAYNLTIHLSIGILLFISLFYTWVDYRGYQKINTAASMPLFTFCIMLVGGVQVFFGGLVSGMKSALSYPNWPKMNGQWIPSIILESGRWNRQNFLLYDKSGFVPALVLFIHRNIAYLLFILIMFFVIKWYQRAGREWVFISLTLLGIIVVQLLLGIFTLLHSIGYIPILYGSLHQATGIILLVFLFYIYLVNKPQYINK
ncbi:MAG: COX15/CtaA family protein [Saprospiraceae bacterium]